MTRVPPLQKYANDETEAAERRASLLTMEDTDGHVKLPETELHVLIHGNIYHRD